MPAEVCGRIKEQTGLRALTRDDFTWTTISYYLRRTGIPMNFGITVSLGFIVGSAIAGQTFYLFTIENLKQFGTLKAMGVPNARLVGMILLQAAVVGAGRLWHRHRPGRRLWRPDEVAAKTVPPAFYMPWHVPALTALAVLVIIALSSLISIRRVLVLEPAIVFRG